MSKEKVNSIISALDARLLTAGFPEYVKLRKEAFFTITESVSIDANDLKKSLRGLSTFFGNNEFTAKLIADMANFLSGEVFSADFSDWNTELAEKYISFLNKKSENLLKVLHLEYGRTTNRLTRDGMLTELSSFASHREDLEKSIRNAVKIKKSKDQEASLYQDIAQETGIEYSAKTPQAKANDSVGFEDTEASKKIVEFNRYLDLLDMSGKKKDADKIQAAFSADPIIKGYVASVVDAKKSDWVGMESKLDAVLARVSAAVDKYIEMAKRALGE